MILRLTATYNNFLNLTSLSNPIVFSAFYHLFLWLLIENGWTQYLFKNWTISIGFCTYNVYGVASLIIFLSIHGPDITWSATYNNFLNLTSLSNPIVFSAFYHLFLWLLIENGWTQYLFKNWTISIGFCTYNVYGVASLIIFLSIHGPDITWLNRQSKLRFIVKTIKHKKRF